MSKVMSVRSPASSSTVPGAPASVPTSSSAEARAAARRAAAVPFLVAMLSLVSAEAAVRVCDAVCSVLLALRTDTALDAFERVVVELDAQEHALFEMVFLGAFGESPMGAIELHETYDWSERDVRDAVCRVMSARLARGA